MPFDLCQRVTVVGVLQIHYAGLVTHTARDTLEHITRSCRFSEEIQPLDKQQVKHLFADENCVHYLYPKRKMMVDFIPFMPIEENIELLFGTGTAFYSTVRKSGGELSGLLSAGSYYRCRRPPESYTIDIFGTDATDLETHLLFHITKALAMTSCEFCLQIFVENGYISRELCKILMKLDIPKCYWFVEGGVSTKTIVEESF